MDSLIRYLISPDSSFDSNVFTWQLAFTVAFAGGVGACIRYGVTRLNLLFELLAKRYEDAGRSEEMNRAIRTKSKLFTRLNALALGTLMANVIGCTLVAWAHIISRDYFTSENAPQSVVLYTVITAGLCGGISTLSTFTAEVSALWHEKRKRAAALYTVLTIFLPMIGALSANFHNMI
jgi:CrcB protein